MNETLYETHGYFETLFDPKANKTIGTRECPAPIDGRPLGQKGDRLVTFHTDFVVNKGHKTVTVRVRKPLELVSTINRLCGRALQST